MWVIYPDAGRSVQSDHCPVACPGAPSGCRCSSEWTSAAGCVAGNDQEELEMPVAFMFSAKDVDQSLYEVAMKGIGREALDAPTPPGFLAHLAGADPEGGWRVVDVWECEDAANAFY